MQFYQTFQFRYLKIFSSNLFLGIVNWKTSLRRKPGSPNLNVYVCTCVLLHLQSKPERDAFSQKTSPAFLLSEQIERKKQINFGARRCRCENRFLLNTSQQSSVSPISWLPSVVF